MGWTYGPVGTLLAELFPVEVRYTGSSMSFNLASVLGAARPRRWPHGWRPPTA
jgi:hypothetical protein